MNSTSLPLNIPYTQVSKYELVISKGYYDYFSIIFQLGSYITYQQFYKLFSNNNPQLSKSYSTQKANTIIKELESLKFIKSDVISKHKYFYLTASGLALALGDYNKIPKTNHKNISLKNNKFTTSLIRVEYYLNYEEIIKADTLFRHLKAITRNIIALTQEYDLDYNISFLKAIYNSNDHKKIKETVLSLPEDDILYIVWVNLYDFFIKLLHQGQTLSTKPLYFKLNVVGSKLTLHYIPEIIIFDLHRTNYYHTKMDRILFNLISIRHNDVNGLRKRYIPNTAIGDSNSSIIGYGLKLIGIDKELLIEKHNSISEYGLNNSNSPFVSVSTVFLDLSTYFSYSYRKIDKVEKIDDFVESVVLKKLNDLLNTD